MDIGQLKMLYNMAFCPSTLVATLPGKSESMTTYKKWIWTIIQFLTSVLRM